MTEEPYEHIFKVNNTAEKELDRFLENLDIEEIKEIEFKEE